MVAWSQRLVEVQEGFREWLPPEARDLPAWTWLSGVAVVLASLWYFRRRRRRLPPGPMGLPWMGAVHCIGKEMHLDLERLRKKYGDIFSMQLAGKLYVVLTGYPVIKEACITRGAEFADRTPNGFTTLTGFCDEIGCAPYKEEGKDNKKFALMTFKRFGVGGPGMFEEKILEEVGYVMDFFTESNGSPVQLERHILNALARALTRIIYSEEYTKDDPAVDRLVQFIRKWFTTVFNESVMTADMFPVWLARTLYKKPIQDAIAMNQEFLQYVQERLDSHRATLDKQNPRDIADVYLSERDNVDKEKLAYTFMIFLPDGVDTLGSVMLWGILYIVYNPQVQDEIQKELDAVVGRSGRPTMVHRKDLIYLQATILEIFRLANVAPIGGTYKPAEDTTLCGYDIPEEAQIMLSLHSVRMDPQTFPDPEKFDPHHFLDSSGQLINTDQAVPFGVGRRMCLGEQIAKMEIYLHLANIFHQFRFSFPPDQPEPSLEPNIIEKIIKMPHTYSVIATPR